jgi:phosphatidylethanolamine/phosphatidyl-N-methylethanolamine N-methyltransferase
MEKKTKIKKNNVKDFKNSIDIKNKILREYYSKTYQTYCFGKSVQATGISYFEKKLEQTAKSETKVDKILEIGAGSGEHLKYIKQIPNKLYVCLDLQDPIDNTYFENLSSNFKRKVKFVKGNAEKLQFQSETFDRVIGTCILHHVSDPLAVLLESRRVAKKGAEIAFIIPTDPGLLNQLVRRFISYPRMKKFTELRPQLIASLDHINSVHALIELSKFVFDNDKIKIKYFPFRLASWNLNLLVRVEVVKTN